MLVNSVSIVLLTVEQGCSNHAEQAPGEAGVTQNRRTSGAGGGETWFPHPSRPREGDE